MSPARATSPTVAALLAACAVLAAVTAALSAPAVAGAAAQPFGIVQFALQTTRTSPLPPFVEEPYEFTQAGGHPVGLTVKVAFATESVGARQAPTRDVKDIAIDLPPGLLANPQAVPACRPSPAKQCPADTQIGVFALHATESNLIAPIVNLAPSGEEAARLGLETPLGPLPLFGRLVREPGGYALSMVAAGLPTIGVESIEVTLWGDPAEAAHDAQRGRVCNGGQTESEAVCEGGGRPSGDEERPFITLPTVCSGHALTATVWTDSWQEPGHFLEAQSSLGPLRSCGVLPFAPRLTLQPDTLQAEAPVAADISLADGGPADDALSPSLLRGASVTLPQGVAVDPSVGSGLQACAASGPEGIDLPSGTGGGGQALSPGEVGEGEEVGPDGLTRLAPGHCPPASTLGSAEVRSPLLATELRGRVYLAAPACGGGGQRQCSEQDAADGALYRIYVELGGGAGGGEPRSPGVIVKLSGEVLVDPATGQLTLELPEVPQLPLAQLSIELFGGSRALLVNPAVCAPATTSSLLEPWAAPLLATVAAQSDYEVTGCDPSPPFVPALVAGSLSADAGAATAFTVQLARSRGEQQLAQVQLRAPAGLSASLASVPRCASAQAAAGTCPAGSLIGSSTVELGNGEEPLRTGGAVYLTGPYAGAPFGLAIVLRALVGPLDLGTIVVRARIDIDPHTGALTITTDSLPRMLLGVPLRLRSLALDIDRSGFLLNPTDCSAKRVRATVLGSQGAVASPSEPFAVGGCRALAFAPRLSASSSARTSLAGGASLDVKLAEPAAPGADANLARLRIALPRALSTRLNALRGSCSARIFAADPARCPSSSVVGVARARTPLLAALLGGPVYLVAHGHNALPAPTVVLEGEGVSLQLSGSTTIEHDGATAISFESLPDLPLRSFELYLPRGRHSVLAAGSDLCAAARQGHPAGRLSLPVELVAQNGIVLHRAPGLAVLGCPTAPARRRPSALSRGRSSARRHPAT